MELNKKNIEIFAAKNYLNDFCISKEEFLEDYRRFSLVKRTTKRLKDGKETNIRLLCNHILCCANTFELSAMKQIVLFDTGEEEKEILKTVLNYFGFLHSGEMKDTKFSLETAKLLKEMDK